MRRVLPKTEEIVRKTNLDNASHYSNQLRCPQSLIFTFLGWSGSGPVSTITITLPYNWSYMATVVVGTYIFLCGCPMDRD
jgi:hypothetical protein